MSNQWGKYVRGAIRETSAPRPCHINRVPLQRCIVRDGAAMGDSPALFSRDTLSGQIRTLELYIGKLLNWLQKEKNDKQGLSWLIVKNDFVKRIEIVAGWRGKVTVPPLASVVMLAGE